MTIIEKNLFENCGMSRKHLEREMNRASVCLQTIFPKTETWVFTLGKTKKNLNYKETIPEGTADRLSGKRRVKWGYSGG